MLTVDPQNTPIPQLHQYLVGAVAPRPIAFVSTMSEEGLSNLAPYSFFNVFSSNPPTLIFSSNRRVRGNTTKDTLSNVLATKEVVVNIVNYSIVHQMALASIDYASDINEFEKSGLTPIASDLVSPFRVKESPVQMECKVKDIIHLGDQGGAGNLVICEILRIHISENILDENGAIDPYKADLMGRMGRAFYARASGANVFPIVQPTDRIGIGIDLLPEDIRKSETLTGKQLWQLASVKAIPELNSEIANDPVYLEAMSGGVDGIHDLVGELLNEEDVTKAWQVILATRSED